MKRNLQFRKYQKKILHRLGLQKTIPDGIDRDNFFELYFSLKTNPFVVQIGTNDGITHDSLYQYITKYNLPALLVEPQPDVFLRLRKNYRDCTNVKFSNVAVGDKDGTMPFYRIKADLVQKGGEYKASSGSSFYREQIVENVLNRLPPRRTDILKHISDNPDDYIEEVEVKTKTLQSLFDEYNIKKVDFLLTDCQGFDFVILKQLDLKKYSPDVINFEHSLLSDEDLMLSRKLLVDAGYTYFVHEGDTCAYKAV